MSPEPTTPVPSNPLSGWATTVTVVVAAIGAVLALLYKLTRWVRIWLTRSYLGSPDLLDLKPKNAFHLKGRSKDCEDLQERCETHLVVFLEGKPGSGRSALVQAGLIPSLIAAGGVLVPILFTDPGLLSDDGLFELLSAALGTALTSEERSRLLGSDLALRPDPASLSLLFAAFHDRLARRPLLIFDQMDDAIASDLPFFRPDGQNWIGPGDLRKQRPFWDLIAQLLSQRQAHGLFVFGSDLGPASSTFRFIEDVRDFSLGPLDPNLLEAIVRELTDAPDAIKNPKGGWPSLREQLVADLRREGSMPIQLAFALRSLRALRHLTPGEYNEPVGAPALSGLQRTEARYLDGIITMAAQASALTKDQVLAALHHLAGGGSTATASPGLAPPPCSPCSIGDLLASSTILKGVQSAKLADALRKLQNSQLVRTTFDSRSNETCWALEHEQLAPAIAALPFPPPASVVEYRERFAAYDVGGHRWWTPKHWLALAPLWLQLRVLALRAGRRFHYAETAGYAVRSLARWLPLFTVVAAVLLYRDHSRAEATKRMLAKCRLPTDLVSTQSHLHRLSLVRCVTGFDWLSNDLRYLQLRRRPLATTGIPWTSAEVNFSNLPKGLVGLDISDLAPSDPDRVNEDAFTSLTGLPKHLRYLNISHNDELATLSGLPDSLTSLSAITRGLARFSPLPASLECLELGSPAFATPQSQLPSDLPSLRSLTLRGTGVKTLRGLPDSLQSLELFNNTRMPDIDVLPPSLTALSVDSSALPSMDAWPIHLQDLHLSRTALTRPAGTGRPYLTELEALTLNDVRVPDWGVLPSTLQSLALIGMEPPQPLPAQLRSLSFEAAAPDHPLPKLPLHLETLRLANVHIDGLLGQLPRQLTGLAVTHATLRSLAGCPPHLTRLDLRSTDHLVTIKELPRSLESLNLLNSRDLERIAAELPQSLRFLNLAGTKIVELPILPPHLEELDISGTHIARLSGLPRGLQVLTLSPGSVRSLKGLPDTVRELRFLERPEDRASRSHFACEDSAPTFERWGCVVRERVTDAH
jgi:outer membrane protein YopM